MNRFFIDYNQLKTLDKDLIRLYHEEAGKRMADLKEIESLITSCVPGAILILARPSTVGTSTVPPSRASVTVILTARQVR